MNFYDWFFREVGREPAGLFSFQHLFTVTLALAIFITTAVILGKKSKGNLKKQNQVLLITGIAIIVIQLSKNIYLLIETDNPLDCLIGNLPLYFCDIPIYMILVAALTKGRFKEGCLDFLAICGLLMGFMGNYFAGNLYPSHAIISFLTLNALFNHCLSAFAAIFIWVTGMNTMKKGNIVISVGILFSFMTLALTVDYIALGVTGTPRNFMFFFHGDGTPFTLFHDLVQGNKIAYQVIIYVLQCGYMFAFYGVYYAIMRALEKRKKDKAVQAANS